MLGKIDVPYESLRYNNMTCTEHYDQINTYHKYIVDECGAAGQCCVPSQRSKYKAG